MRLYFSSRVSVVCGLLALGMLRLSYWQWERHVQKVAYIATMQDRLSVPVAELADLALSPDLDWNTIPYRRVRVNGRYDFDHEVIVRNRRYDSLAGVHVLTPLKLEKNAGYILVNRGFVPQSKAGPVARKAFRLDHDIAFIGLVKESAQKSLLAPSDPETGPGREWVDAFHRADIPKIARQLPFPVAPVYLEIMSTTGANEARVQIVAESSAREQMMFLGEQKKLGAPELEGALNNYPIPVFDTVIPPGRHLGYVFEWAAMAFGTLLAGFILQLRPRRRIAAIAEPYLKRSA